MRWKEITEAPLGDFATYGDMSSPGSFRADDLRAMNNPKWLTKVRSTLQKLDPNLNLYMINATNGEIEFDTVTSKGSFKANDLSNLDRYIGLHKIGTAEKLIGKLPPDYAQSLNVIMIENEGDERIPLTPWMIGHRMVHGMLTIGDEGTSKRGFDAPSNGYTVQAAYRIYNSFMNEIESILLKGDQHDLEIKNAAKRDENLNDRGRNLTQRYILQLFGTMRSAREGQIERSPEFLVELFTQYIVQGRVHFNRVDADALGRAEPKDIAPADEKLFKKALNFAVYNTRVTGEDFVKEIFDRPTKPQPYYNVYDPSGTLMAQFSQSAPPEKVKKEEERGNRVERVEVTRQAEAGYQKKMANIQRARDLYDLWSEKGWLTMRHTHLNDRLDAFLDQKEKEFAAVFKNVIDRCKGKLLMI